MIVLDTNVLSETFKPSPSGVVLRWLASHEPRDIFTTSVTQAEILYGVERLPDGKRKGRLLEAVEKFFTEDLQTPILPFDEQAACAFAKLAAKRGTSGRSISHFDGMIAAITLAHRAALATRDIGDFEGCGVEIINPWSE